MGAERATFHEHFQSLFLPWAYGTMPETVVNAIKKAGGSDAARDFVLERFRTIGIAPDELMMQKINGYCSEEGLQSIPCNFIPILAALERHAKRHTLALSSGSITATGLRPLAEDTLAWLRGVNFSPESLANPAHEKDPLSILYLVLRLHDTLYQYKDYKNLLDVCDMPEDNKDAWVDALHVYSQYLHNPDLTLASLLDDTVRLEECLRAFERGFAMWRNGAYHDFISNYAADWFAASGNEGIAARASLFARLCDLYFRENTEGSNSFPAIRVLDAMLAEWIGRAGEDGVLEVTPYQINRILLHALCYPADTWSLLFQQCLPKLLEFIRNRCNQEQNTAGDALSRDSWPEALLAQVEHVAALDSTGEPPVPVLLTPGTITPASSLDVALLLAASRDMPAAIVHQIVELPGFHPNATNRNKLTPFYLAAEYGNTVFAAALMGRGAAYDVKFKDQFPMLQVAIENQHLSFVQWFLQALSEHQRVEVVMAKTDEGTSMVHLAAQYPEFLKEILVFLPDQLRVDIVMRMRLKGDTVLHTVARNNPRFLKEILNCLPAAARTKAVKGRNDCGITVMYLITGSHHELLIDVLNCLPEADRAGIVLQTYSIGNTLLHLAAVYPETLQSLLDYLPKEVLADAITLKNQVGITVLHLIAEKARPDLLKQLLDYLPEIRRADAVMAQNKLGDTLLHNATNDSRSLIALLDYLPKAAVADALRLTGRYKKTVLHLAAFKCRDVLMRLLDYLPEPARTDAIVAQDGNGDTVLHFVASYYKTLELVINSISKPALAGALTLKNTFGETVLHGSANYSPDVLKQLLDYLPEEARLDAVMMKDSYGNTVLHLIAQNRPDLLVQLLDCLPEASRASALEERNVDTVFHNAVENTRYLLELQDYFPKAVVAEAAEAVMLKTPNEYTVLHLIAGNRPDLLVQLLDCLPEAARAGALLAQDYASNTVLHLIAEKRPDLLVQLLDCLSEQSRAGVILAQYGYLTRLLTLVENAGDTESLSYLKAILEQVKNRTANQLGPDSSSLDHDSDSAPSPTASSSDRGTSALIGFHSFFILESLRPQDPDNQGEQNTLKR
ncbi:ankyrin repeat domain-containing protein [Legionella moravica]|uniref:ankyrin repeat domain-containing protein n=2 Tax=Legionella moravica TaxID=39962 RepID=UPI0011C08027|nr:ankyrin repeat domain-containing protein [Legionella moravica]